MSYQSRLKQYFSERDRAWILLMLVAASMVYLPFINNPFIFDDLNFFATSAIGTYSNNGFDLSLRWLPYASLGRLYTVFSDEFPHIYRLCNLLLHFVNTVLIFYFLRHLIAASMIKGVEPSWIVRGAWLGAMVFCLHPVAAFAVGYAIQISILMATTFALLMQMAYLRGLLSGEKRWFVLAVIAYFLACFSKEHSVLTPAILVAMGLLVHTDHRVDRRVLGLTWLAFIAIAVLVTLRARGVFGSPYEPMAAQLFVQQGIAETDAPMLHLLSALTQAGLFFKYLFLWILPDPSLMSIDMRESFSVSASAWQNWIGGIAFVLYGVLGTKWLLRGGLIGMAGFAMLYPWLQFWVEMVGIRVQEPFVLYRSYLWMPGMMLFFPLLLAKLSERKSLLTVISLVIVLVPLTWGRLWVFADQYRLWNEAAILLKNERELGADRIFYNRGQAEMAQKKWEAASLDFKRSADISPQLEPIHYALGWAYFNLGRLDDALAQFDTAITIKPDDDRAYFGKGLTLKRMHRDKESMQQMELSCKLKNAFACLIVSLPNRNRK